MMLLLARLMPGSWTPLVLIPMVGVGLLGSITFIVSGLRGILGRRG